MDRFLQRKKSILSKTDKSNIGKWDKQIISLCDKINKSDDYYTTSSCSGRIVLMIDQEKKSPNLFLAVSHDLIDLEWLKEIINEMMDQTNTFEPDISQGSSSERTVNTITNLKAKKFISKTTKFNYGRSWCKPNLEPDYNAGLIKNLDILKSINLKNKNIKFKCEPPMFHVACRDLKSAVLLLEKAEKAGLKHSGIHSISKKIILEINGSDRLEFPLVYQNKVFVSDDFLKIIVKRSNEKLKKGWAMIGNLEKSITYKYEKV